MRVTIILALLASTLFAACRDEGGVSEAATVEGRWELERATRNNMETRMLEGLYYDFGPGGVLSTNLMGNESDGSYTWETTTITTDGVVPPLTYEVLSLSDSTLHLRTELQGFRFDFEMARGN